MGNKSILLLIALVFAIQFITLSESANVPSINALASQFNLTFSSDTADSNVTAVASGNYTADGLAIWLSLARMFRTSVQPPSKFNIYDQNNEFDYTVAIKYFIPSIILTAVCFLLAVFCLILFPCVCCFCYWRVRKPYFIINDDGEEEQKKPPSPYFPMVLIMLCMGALIAGVVLGYIGVNVLTDAMNNLLNSVLSLIDSLSDKINELYQTVNAIVDQISPTVTNAINRIYGIPYTGFATNVTNQLTSLTTTITLVSTQINNTKASGNNVITNVGNLLNQVTYFKSNFSNVLTMVGQLGNNMTTGQYNNLTVSLYASINVSSYQSQINSVSVSVDMSTLTNSLSLFDTLPDLNAISSTITSNFGNVSAIISGVINTTVSTINSGLGGQLPSLKTSISGNLGPMVTQLENTLSDGRNTVVTQAGQAIKFNNYRVYFLWALFVILGLLIFFILSVMMLKIPIALKPATEVSLLCSALFWLLCGILFMVTTPIGIGCFLLEQYQLAPIAPVIGQTTVNVLTAAWTGLESCNNTEGTSIFDFANDIVASTGSNTSLSIDPVTLVDSFLTSYDFNSVANNLDIASAIQIPGDFNSIRNQVNSFNISAIDLSALNNLNFTNTLASYLKSVKDSLITLNSTINDTTIQYFPSIFATTANDRAIAASAYYRNISSIIAAIDTLNQTNLVTMRNLANSLPIMANQSIANLTNAIGTVNNLLNQKDAILNTIGGFANNTKNFILQNTIPGIISDIRVFAYNSSQALRTAGRCKKIGTSFFAVEQAICSRLVTGFDSMWWTFGYLAFFLTWSALGTGLGVVRFKAIETRVKKEKRNFKDMLKFGKKA